MTRNEAATFLRQHAWKIILLLFGAGAIYADGKRDHEEIKSDLRALRTLVCTDHPTDSQCKEPMP